jgi:hypothetical protein
MMSPIINSLSETLRIMMAVVNSRVNFNSAFRYHSGDKYRDNII